MGVSFTHLQYLQRNSLMLETTELVSGITFPAGVSRSNGRCSRTNAYLVVVVMILNIV
jgi:hypothetical protein